MVRGVGLEPTCLAATGPKPVASANFASRAQYKIQFLPELPNPPVPLSESLKCEQSSKVTAGSLQMTIWAIRSPRSIL